MNIGWYDNLTSEEKTVLATLSAQYLAGAFKGIDGLELENSEVCAPGENESIPFIKGSKGNAVRMLDKVFQGTMSESTFKTMCSLAREPVERERPFASGLDNQVMVGLGHTSGDTELFDYPKTVNRFVRMTVKTVNYYTDERFESRAHHPRGDREMLTLALAPEQYVRAMCSDSTDIPCTLMRTHGSGNEVPTSKIPSDEIRIDLRETLEDKVQPLADKVNEVREYMKSASLTSKKTLKELTDKLAEVIALNEQVNEDLSAQKTEAAMAIAQEHVKRLEESIEDEVARLPENIQEDTRRQMRPLLLDIKAGNE